MNTRPPWSRRVSTQPLSTTVRPTCSVESSPQVFVRLSMSFRCLKGSVVPFLEDAGSPYPGSSESVKERTSVLVHLKRTYETDERGAVQVREIPLCYHFIGRSDCLRRSRSVPK